MKIMNLFGEESEEHSNEEGNALDSYNRNQNINNISIINERNYWKNYLIDHFVYLPKECPQCHHINIKIGELNNINNPLRLVCNNYRCLYRTNLRKFSFLFKFPKQPASVIIKILEKFILEENNASIICKYINDYFTSINLSTIRKILKWFRQAFAHYIKDIYKLNKLGNRNGISNISVDESMFTHINGQKIWVVGAKNNSTGNIRIDVFKNRNSENLKTFIFNHIKENNNIITDGWQAYNFLDDDDVNYKHEVHIHGHQGNFGFGEHSTSHIEGVWGILKDNIRKVYTKIPTKNFILFLREAEMRYIMRDLTNKEKEKKILEIFEYLYNTINFELYDLDELEDAFAYDY